MVCHHNPFGNGPLNDYGRALSASAISSRSLYNENYPEEKISNLSSFLFNKPSGFPVRPAIGHRSLVLKRDLAQPGEVTNYIHMQTDASLTAFYKNKMVFSGTWGYAPRPQSLARTDDKLSDYRTREHYIGVRPTPNLGLYVGLLDKIYGIRIAEHNSYSRTITNLSQNDQAHGAQTHFIWNKFEGGLGYFIGNLVQKDKPTRQVGFSGKVERTIGTNNLVGASYLNSSSTYVNNQAMALHGTLAYNKGSSSLFELGITNKNSKTDLTKNVKHTYAMTHTYLQLTRGLYLGHYIEYLKDQTNTTKYKIGPGIQYFPIQRIELKFDLLNTRNISTKSSSKDVWDLLLQFHIYV
jgi:hypothetical protein